MSAIAWTLASLNLLVGYWSESTSCYLMGSASVYFAVQLSRSKWGK
jgi:hypothetical protein